MKSTIEIDLNQPFEHVLAALLGLPSGDSTSHSIVTDAQLKKLLRYFYEAANGRQVETTIGFIPIAPPVAAFLKARPFIVVSRIDFLMAAASRIISGPNYLTEERTGRIRPPCSVVC